MAAVQSYTVQIDINSKGARVIVKDLQQVQTSATGAASAMTVFRRALLGVTALIGAKQIIEFSDSLVNLSNRLRLVTDSTTQVYGVTRDLLDIAKDTRADFDSTATIYSRLALSARNLGLSQAQLLQVTENLNKAVLLSGSNSREAANGLIQLSQAIASNRLGGDELRSTLEQLPLVADLIGKQLVKMGIATKGTRGEVRQLGFEGKITADVIIDALLAATKDLQDQFEKTTPTISQAFEVLRTSVIDLVFQFNDATGAGTAFADLILLIAKNIDTLAKVVLFFATVAAVKMIAGLGGIRAAALSVSAALGFWPTIIGAVIVGLVQLADYFDLVGQSASRFNSASNDAIAETYKNLGKLSADQRKEVEKLIRDSEIIQRQLGEQDNLGFFSKLIGNGLSDKEIEKAQKDLNKMTQALKDISVAQRGAPDPTIEQKKQADLIGKIRRELDQEYNSLKLTNRERAVAVDLAKIEERLRAKKIGGQQLADLLKEFKLTLERNQAQQEYADILASLREPAIDYQHQSAAIAKIIAEYPMLYDRATAAQREFFIQSLAGAQDAASGLARGQAKLDQISADKATAAEKALTDLKQPMVDYEARVAGLNAVLAKTPELQDEVNRSLVDARIAFLQTKTDIGSGLERGFLSIRQDVTDLASVAESALTNAFSNAEDAMLDFFTTGKLSMTDFVNSLQRDLARLALRGLVTGVLGSTLGLNSNGGGAAGLAGFFTSLFGGASNAPGSAKPETVNVPQYATGGSFTVGGSGGVDSQMVAFRASPNERVSIETPEQQRRSRGRNGRPVVVNMTVVTPDAQSFGRSQGQIAARQQALLSRFAERNN